MEVSNFEVLFFLTLLVYTAPHIMVFGAVFCDAAFPRAGNLFRLSLFKWPH